MNIFHYLSKTSNILVMLHEQRITHTSTFYPLGTLNVWKKFKANHPIVEISRSAPKWWTNQATDLPFCQHGLNWTEQKGTGWSGVEITSYAILIRKKGNMKLSGCAVGVFESWTQVLFVGSDRQLLWKWSERSIFSFFDEALLWLLQNGNDPRGILQSFYGFFTTTCSIFIITLIGPRESTDRTVQIEEDFTTLCIECKIFLFECCYDADSDSIAHMISVWSRTLAGELCRKASGSLESSDGRRSWSSIGHLWDEHQKGRENMKVYEWEKASETDALVRWVWC